ncbi:MAG TPA: rhomboid family intramembrane serine protease, partial [Chloroflexota bacterium]|nr:rhomboid family intramembrane serine protease [Chloroflexota bacterium]
MYLASPLAGTPKGALFLIPLDDNPQQRRRHFPVVTLLIIAANVAVFLYELSLGPALDGFVRAYGAIPANITGTSPIPSLSPIPVYLTLITSMFIHGGFLHIAGN